MRARQLSGKPDGSNPLIYTGTVPNMVIMPRRPNVSDVQQYEIGYWWVIPKADESPSEEIWILVSKDNNLGLWKRLGGSSSGSFVVKQYFTTSGSGTYTPTSGMVNCYVECIGGGGSGNTVNTPATTRLNNGYANCPGGAGAYTAKLYTADQIGASQSYSVGAGGVAPTADANANGNNGGDTTFMGMTAGGGQGGQYNNSVPGTSYETSSGGTPSGGDINTNGGEGTWNIIDGAGITPFSYTLRARAGSSFYGVGPSYYISLVTGATGTSGSNGSGGGSLIFSSVGAGLVIGGTGGDGMIIITEYIG